MHKIMPFVFGIVILVIVFFVVFFATDFFGRQIKDPQAGNRLLVINPVQLSSNVAIVENPILVSGQDPLSNLVFIFVFFGFIFFTIVVHGIFFFIIEGFTFFFCFNYSAWGVLLFLLGASALWRYFRAPALRRLFRRWFDVNRQGFFLLRFGETKIHERFRLYLLIGRFGFRLAARSALPVDFSFARHDDDCWSLSALRTLVCDSVLAEKRLRLSNTSGSKIEIARICNDQQLGLIVMKPLSISIRVC
mmetsp:Transcript_5778/g.13858  ORF Transcript_5778/g.13858 Transcript_5778/m.13858 type:complete len:248 (-) Transcript_5778:1-744(-)